MTNLRLHVFLDKQTALKLKRYCDKTRLKKTAVIHKALSALFKNGRKA